MLLTTWTAVENVFVTKTKITICVHALAGKWRPSGTGKQKDLLPKNNWKQLWEEINLKDMYDVFNPPTSRLSSIKSECSMRSHASCVTSIPYSSCSMRPYSSGSGDPWLRQSLPDEVPCELVITPMKIQVKVTLQSRLPSQFIMFINLVARL